MTPRHNSISASDENTPLLATEQLVNVAPEAEVQTANGLRDHKLKPPLADGERERANGAGDGGGDLDKALPKLQIALLCFARIIEPMAFFGIFPFVNKMIQETGDLEEEDVGFYSGLIVSFDFS
jgi:hypothetical protein